MCSLLGGSATTSVLVDIRVTSDDMRRVCVVPVSSNVV